jgi:hypothetical protein
MTTRFIGGFRLSRPTAVLSSALWIPIAPPLAKLPAACSMTGLDLQQIAGACRDADLKAATDVFDGFA